MAVDRRQVIMLDTHVLLWYLDDDKRLGRKTMATSELVPWPSLLPSYHRITSIRPTG